MGDGEMGRWEGRGFYLEGGGRRREALGRVLAC